VHPKARALPRCGWVLSPGNCTTRVDKGPTSRAETRFMRSHRTRRSRPHCGSQLLRTRSLDALSMQPTNEQQCSDATRGREERSRAPSLRQGHRLLRRMRQPSGLQRARQSAREALPVLPMPRAGGETSSLHPSLSSGRERRSGCRGLLPPPPLLGGADSRHSSSGEV